MEIYCFDKDSDKYKAIEEGNGAIKATAVNDGVIIITDDEDSAAAPRRLNLNNYVLIMH